MENRQIILAQVNGEPHVNNVHAISLARMVLLFRVNRSLFRNVIAPVMLFSKAKHFADLAV